MTIGELRSEIAGLNPNNKVYMYSDEEGNSINNLFTIEICKGKLFLIPDSANLEI